MNNLREYPDEGDYEIPYIEPRPKGFCYLCGSFTLVDNAQFCASSGKTYGVCAKCLKETRGKLSIKDGFLSAAFFLCYIQPIILFIWYIFGTD